MYNFRKSLKTLVGLLVLMAVIAAVTPFTGHSQDAEIEPLATQDVRVVNTAASPALTKVVNPATAPVLTRSVDEARGSNLVMLTCSLGSCKRVLSTGAASNTEFVVPAGQILIVRDVNWAGKCASNCTTGGAQLALGIGSSAVYISTLRFTSNGVGSASETMNTGFAVGAGKSIKMVIDFVDVSGSLDHLFLHGYLVPAA